jgi:hypothetical protein
MQNHSSDVPKPISAQNPSLQGLDWTPIYGVKFESRSTGQKDEISRKYRIYIDIRPARASLRRRGLRLELEEVHMGREISNCFFNDHIAGRK